MSYVQELGARYSEIHKRLLDPPPKLKEPPPEQTPTPEPKPPQRRILCSLSTDIPIVRPRLHDLLRRSGREFGVDQATLISQRRNFNIAMARQVYFYLAYHYTRASLKQIGTLVGGKDHTTVLHGVRKVGRLIEKNEKWDTRIKGMIGAITSELRLQTTRLMVCPSCGEEIELG